MLVSIIYMEFRFFESPKETKIALKNRVVRDIGVKLQCSTEMRETKSRVREIAIPL